MNHHNPTVTEAHESHADGTVATVVTALAKLLATTLSVLVIAAFSVWALSDAGPSKDLDSVSAAASVVGTPGYWLAASDGGIFNYGDAVFDGSAGGMHLNAPIVGMAATPDGGGYWLVASDGGIFNYGDAVFHGSAGGMHLNAPIVGMAATPDGGGYWLVASDGGIFNYGDAVFHGSAGGMHLNAPIVGMAATPDGGGYWLVASDGGIFNYGDAVFHGSAGGMHLNKPVVGMATDATGAGYWLVASDGGIFNYGDAVFHGSTGGMHLNKPVVGMATDATGAGYWLVASDGGIFNYGDASFEGSTGNQHLNAPVVALTSDLLSVTTEPAQANPAWSCTTNEPIDDLTQAPSGWTGSTYYVYWEKAACDFPSDPTNFVGMNDPTDTGGNSNEVDQDAWAPICTNSSGQVISDDPPSSYSVNDATCVNRETQEVQANSAQDFVVTNDTPTNPSGAVTSYPNVWAHGYGGVLDDYTSLTSTYNLTMPINANTSAWAMQDDWLTEPTSPAGEQDYEVEIQYDFTNNAACPSSGKWALTATDVTFGGANGVPTQQWHLCDGQNAHNADGSCPTTYPYCGAVVWKLGATEADRPSESTTSGRLDLKAMFQWLEDNDVPGESYPYITPGSSIDILSEGWEIASTGGVPEQFDGKGFTVDATGAPSS